MSRWADWFSLPDDELCQKKNAAFGQWVGVGKSCGFAAVGIRARQLR